MVSNNSFQRLSDIGNLPTAILSPIDGYENKPLVSLEEAVKSLVHFVPKVERNAKFVKDYCKTPLEGLTSDESASIMLYTYEATCREDSLYVKLNETLRSEQRKNLIPWFLYLRLILTALARLPSQHCFVFRGVRGDLWKEYDKGKKFIWWGFSSCTTTIGVLENNIFCGTGGERTIFQIDCTTAKNIKNHSLISAEDEVLVLPATQFIVKSCFDAGNGLHMIHLMEIKPDYDLLEPIPMSESISTKIKCKGIRNVEKNGFTVAGGNGHGLQLNQLNEPCGIHVDEDSTVYVADCYNHRVISWRESAHVGVVIAGGNGQGKALNQLDRPTDVIFDKQTNSVVICDEKRVVRWNLNKNVGEILVENIDSYGIAMDGERFIYVSNWKKHEVRKYRMGDKNGILVAGGNGKGDRLNQLNYPGYLFVDQEHSIYISDRDNHRVMKWKKGATQGIIVAGGNGPGSNLDQLYYPYGILVDELGAVYVADSANSRLLRWSKGATKGDVIVDGNGQGNKENQFNYLRGLSFDRKGYLYVSNARSNRVQRFLIT